VLNSPQVSFDFVIVRIGKFNLPARLKALKRFAGLPGVDPDAVGGHVAKFIFNPVFDPGSGPEEQNEHKNPPGDAESGQHRSQSVFLDGAVNLLESIDKMQHAFTTQGF
jgi:hypothetical protein